MKKFLALLLIFLIVPTVVFCEDYIIVEPYDFSYYAGDFVTIYAQTNFEKLDIKIISEDGEEVFSKSNVASEDFLTGYKATLDKDLKSGYYTICVGDFSKMYDEQEFEVVNKSENAGHTKKGSDTKDDEEKSVKTEHFKDLSGFDWAKEEIEYLYDKKVVDGMEEGMFFPQEKVTRAQFTVMLARAFGFTEGEDFFLDVNPNDWFFNEVRACEGLNIIDGYGDATFRPNNYITREDMTIIAVRGAYMAPIEIKEYDFPKLFTDDNDISFYAKDLVYKARENGFVEGDNNFFFPKDNTTRAEAAVLIYNLLLKF